MRTEQMGNYPYWMWQTCKVCGSMFDFYYITREMKRKRKMKMRCPNCGSNVFVLNRTLEDDKRISIINEVTE